MEISAHAFNRINNRVMSVSTLQKAKKMAQEAYTQGYTIEQLEPDFKNLAGYLKFKLKGESKRTEVRLYKEYVWLWNGRQKVLRTVYPIERSKSCCSDLKKLKKKELEK